MWPMRWTQSCFFEFSGVQELLLEGATGTEIARILWLIQSLLSAVTNKKYWLFEGHDAGQIWMTHLTVWKTLVSAFESHISL